MKSTLFAVLAGAYAQSNYSIIEGYYRNNLKVDIYTRTWEPAKGNTVAKLVFVHGFNDMSSHYNDIFSKFAEAGIKVHAFDQVGCGKTGEKANNLGGAMGMDRVRIDIDDAIERIYDTKTPLFLMGHSFGGSTTIDYLARGKKRDLISGAIAAAPDLELAPESQPNSLAAEAIKALVSIAPKMKVHFSLDANFLSRNKTYVEEVKKEPLQNSFWASIQARDVISGGRYILDGGYKEIKVPRLLIAHGSGDKITNHNTSEKFAQTLLQQDLPKSVIFKSYPGAYHELHNETNKDEVIVDFIKWILDKIETKSSWRRFLPGIRKF
ncbi:hypothetical protein DSO57_1032770 [Entomophthora muscae]|uniref:Uncharacterized protein n=1 Tax=Entomophthora muscae TaxID=34485 RepID=A0ACC2TCB0_9FUNG|nr:hypothetical protein DSO57_1032770 [Entomophthora muscae]